MRKIAGIVLCLFLTLALFVSVPKGYGLESTRSPGTVTSVKVDDTDIVWYNPNNVKVSDNQHTRADKTSSPEETYRLKATNFGFSLPSTAIITGIEVEIERYKAAEPHGDPYVTDTEIYIIKSDESLGSNNKAATSTQWPFHISNEAYRAYGGSGDLWGESWTASDINDPDFGVSVRARVGSFRKDGIGIANIDHVRITVYYAPPQPILQSAWTDKAPKIDGVSSNGEWFNLVIYMQPPNYPIEAYVYMMNDNNWLYVLVDAIGDTTNDADDECLLIFDYNSFISVNIIGASGTTKSNSYRAAVGYGPSPHGSGNHKIYEFKIPLSYIGLVPGGGSVDFCSPEEGKGGPSIVFDDSTGWDNIYPYWLEPGLQSTWGLLFASLRTAGPAVGGYYMEVNRLAIQAPYIMLTVGLLGLVYAVKRRR